MKQIEPEKPADLDPLAEELLTGLASGPGAASIVLGGHFALKHYCDFRKTHDVDAWWTSDCGEAVREQVRTVVREVMSKMAERHHLELRHRRFGDTESWELRREGRAVFSFQIADRTVQTEPYLPSPWPPIQIEAIAENVGSKMNALVLRGAPRDFVDIRHLVANGFLSVEECWQAWHRKNPDLNLSDAKAEVARHLQELEARRPLDTISDSNERSKAAHTRAWFREHFLELPRQ